MHVWNMYALQSLLNTAGNGGLTVISCADKSSSRMVQCLSLNVWAFCILMPLTDSRLRSKRLVICNKKGKKKECPLGYGSLWSTMLHLCKSGQTVEDIWEGLEGHWVEGEGSTHQAFVRFIRSHCGAFMKKLPRCLVGMSWGWHFLCHLMGFNTQTPEGAAHDWWQNLHVCILKWIRVQMWTLLIQQSSIHEQQQ